MTEEQKREWERVIDFCKRDQARGHVHEPLLIAVHAEMEALRLALEQIAATEHYPIASQQEEMAADEPLLTAEEVAAMREKADGARHNLATAFMLDISTAQYERIVATLERWLAVERSLANWRFIAQEGGHG